MKRIGLLLVLMACNGRGQDDTGTPNPDDTGTVVDDTSETGETGETGDTGPDLTVGDPSADVSVQDCANTLPTSPGQSPAERKSCPAPGIHSVKGATH